MSDYRPTMEEIRAAYKFRRWEGDVVYSAESEAEFDRWLDGIRWEAWEEGEVAGRNRAHHTNMSNDIAERSFPNPYQPPEGRQPVERA